MIAIIDYRAGNLTSVKLAFDALQARAVITSDPAAIASADRVVFPGVGAAGSAMRNIDALGLRPVLAGVVAKGTPFLGICLGTQIIFEHSEEDGGVQGLGLIPGKVKLFRPTDRFDKVPQMGWNSVRQIRRHVLFDQIADGSEFYFVHSYYPAPTSAADVCGETDYAGIRFASVIGRGNLAATQFHPEKSGRLGLKFLANFLAWNPESGAPC